MEVIFRRKVRRTKYQERKEELIRFTEITCYRKLTEGSKGV